MTVSLLLKLWRELGLGILFVALVITAMLYDKQGIQIERIKSAYKQEATELRADYEAKARQIESENYEKTIDAINEAKIREQIIVADNADARAAVNSLSDTIDKLASNAQTDAEYRIEYAATTGKLLKECSGSIAELARTADGHVNDIRLLQQSRR